MRIGVRGEEADTKKIETPEQKEEADTKTDTPEKEVEAETEAGTEAETEAETTESVNDISLCPTTAFLK